MDTLEQQFNSAVSDAIVHLPGSEEALAPFGWTGEKAGWIAFVCLHSGANLFMTFAPLWTIAGTPPLPIGVTREMGWWIAFLFFMVFVMAWKVDKLEDRTRGMNERLDDIEKTRSDRNPSEWDEPY